MPVFITPVFISIIGTTNFGKVATLQAIISFFTILTNFGYELSAVRDISINIEYDIKINKTIGLVYLTRTVILVLAFPIYVFVCSFFFSFSSDNELIFFGYLVVFSTSYISDWYFQGIQKMEFIAWSNILAKVLFLVCFFLFIRNIQDYKRYNLLIAFSNLISVIIGFLLIYGRYRINFKVIKKSDVLEILKKNIFLVASNFSLWGTTNFIFFVLAYYNDNSVVGEYSAVDKIISVLRLLLSFFLSAIFPKICQIRNNRQELLRFFRYVYSPLVVLILSLCFTLNIFSNQVSFFLLKQNNINTVNLIENLSFLPLIVCLNIPFYAILLARNKTKFISNIFALSALLAIFISTVLISRFQLIGLSISLNIVELFITIGLILGVIFFNKTSEVVT